MPVTQEFNPPRRSVVIPIPSTDHPAVGIVTDTDVRRAIAAVTWPQVRDPDLPRHALTDPVVYNALVKGVVVCHIVLKSGAVFTGSSRSFEGAYSNDRSAAYTQAFHAAKQALQAILLDRMSEQPAELGRGTGRTTRAIMAAHHGAIYVSHTVAQRHHAHRIATQLGRTDLIHVTELDLLRSPDKRDRQIVIDHACSPEAHQRWGDYPRINCD